MTPQLAPSHPDWRPEDDDSPADQGWILEAHRRLLTPESTVRALRDATTVERRGQSYVVTVGLVVITFRDVRSDGELTADVAIAYNEVHLFRTTTTLSLNARERLAKQAAGLVRTMSSSDMVNVMRDAVFAGVEAVLAAEEQVGQPVDLRTASMVLPAGGTHVVSRFWPYGSTGLVSPGDAGKSTFARALAVSIAHGIEVIPSLEPVGPPHPVLYVAGEDPGAHWHAQSVEAICRGKGISRANLANPIELFDARGRPLHRIARSLAERAADFGAIILDSQQTLLPALDGSGNLRDRDTMFWHAVDQIDRPVLVIAHPNRADARDWEKADDGRIAGSEVNRDRLRMAWRGIFKDEPAVAGSSYRRYTFTNTKSNHGPREAPIAFAAAWEYGFGGDPGTLRFHAADAIRVSPAPLTPEMAATVAAFEAGTTTPAGLAKLLGIPENTAKSRLRILRARGAIGGSDVGQ